MTEYIERRVAIRELRDVYEREFPTADGAFDLFANRIVPRVIKSIPAAEVEPVRCRDCRWRGSEQCAMFYRCDCGEQHTWETDGDFCSYGERKEG